MTKVGYKQDVSQINFYNIEMKLFKDKKKTGNLSTQYYEMLMTSQMNSSDKAV